MIWRNNIVTVLINDEYVTTLVNSCRPYQIFHDNDVE